MRRASRQSPQRWQRWPWERRSPAPTRRGRRSPRTPTRTSSCRRSASSGARPWSPGPSRPARAPGHRHGQLHDLPDPGRDRRRRNKAAARGPDRLQARVLHALRAGACNSSSTASTRPMTGDPADRDGHDGPQPRRHLGSAVRRLERSCARHPRPCSREQSAWIAGTLRRASRLFNANVTHAPGAFDYNLQPQIGGCCGYRRSWRSTARATSGSRGTPNATGATGMYVQQLDPATAAPIGTPCGAQQ